MRPADNTAAAPRRTPPPPPRHHEPSTAESRTYPTLERDRDQVRRKSALASRANEPPVTVGLRASSYRDFRSASSAQQGGHMTAYQTVVVGTDGSDSSYLAVDRAARIAADADATLVIACAYHPARQEDVSRAQDEL